VKPGAAVNRAKPDYFFVEMVLSMVPVLFIG
jgi:hypothetical protein